MSGPSAPSPAPRSGSIGPNGPLPSPSVPLINGVGSSNAAPTASSSSGSGAGASSGGSMSQQNLNQIVMDYLHKKGYKHTEEMLRREATGQDVTRDTTPKPPLQGPPKYFDNFNSLCKWTEDTLEIYKAELRRVLWPVFVHCYLNLVAGVYASEARRLMRAHHERFRQEHDEDLKWLERITLPEHLEEDNIGKLYRTNHYRLVMSEPAFQHLIQFLESLQAHGSSLLINIIHHNLDVRRVDRTADDRFSFASVILRSAEGEDVPAEDEGIPGHMPGNATSSTDKNTGTKLATLKLGKLQMDKETEGDVRAEAQDLDLEMPPASGQDSYERTHEILNIKQEDEDDGPTRTEIPFPTSSAREVAIEVQKIREHRDRIKIEDRTGGIGPGVSVCMYTFHNTFDSITCLDFSDDNALVAAGTSESYIRVWSMDGKAIPSNDTTQQPASSHRLIGHSGPVYAVSFAPSSSSPPSVNDVQPETKWLLSSSADSTIRLWNLDVWQQLVVYKAHIGPVWDVRWGPFGHYFVSGGHDKTARIWSTDKIRPLRLLAGHDDDVDVVAWHPNSAYVFTAGSDRTVRMWTLNTGNPVRMFTGHTAVITALACSTSGKQLASADEGGTILVWDLNRGRLVKRMRGHSKGGIWSLSWSVESSVLVSGGADGTVRVWDVGERKSDTANKSAGEAGKVDGSLSTVPLGGSIGGGVGGGVMGSNLKKGRKDAVVSGDQISAFPTKSSPVYRAKFTRMNLVVAGGAYLP